MANTAIRDLGAGALAADSAFPIQNTSAATVAEQASFSKMGGLVHAANTITTANLTASVGTLHKVTIAGLTANRDFILPDTALVGERVGVYVVDGDNSYVLQIKTAASASEINGADASSTLWSSVFIQNEIVIFECIKAGGAGDTDWIVIQDGRIPCVIAEGSGAAESLTTTSTFTVMDLLDTVGYDNGNIFDSANERVLIRRAGRYDVAANVRILSVSGSNTIAFSAAKNGTSSATGGYHQSIVSSTGDYAHTISGKMVVAAGDYISVVAYKTDSTNRNVDLKTFSLEEIL